MSIYKRGRVYWAHHPTHQLMVPNNHAKSLRLRATPSISRVPHTFALFCECVGCPHRPTLHADRGKNPRNKLR